MAYLEWRKLNFFDLVTGADGGSIKRRLKDNRVTVCTCGNGQVVVGDSSGDVHVFKLREFQVALSFHAYDRNIRLAYKSKFTSYLVTVGEDEVGISPLIKVWNLSKLDKHGNPICLRISRATVPNRAVVPSALAVLDNNTAMAIGFDDGSVILYRGDITREKSSKQKVIKDCYGSITGLSFFSSAKTLQLFVATVNSVEMFDFTQKEKESSVSLDKAGCDLGCSVLADSSQDSHFYVARDIGVTCYINGVRGPCYAIAGKKTHLSWLRNYLVIVSRDVKAGRISSTNDKDSFCVTLLDIKNGFMVFNDVIEDVFGLLVEWGSLYVLSLDSDLKAIVEKNLNAKLPILFKKNLYDISIRIAKSQECDAGSLMEIFRQYGDYLFSKSEYEGAISQYIKTIGQLEPSYVIKKYLKSQQVQHLTTYLQALHKEGKASGDHTTLLLNCFIKLNEPDLLKQFLLTKDKEVDFDVEVAIDVCRHVSTMDALLLAEKHDLHEWYLTIQIEDTKKYTAALNYIGKLSFYEAEQLIKKYGVTLLKHIPQETTEFLQKLCTDYRSSIQPLVDPNMLDHYVNVPVVKASPEEFIHYFLNNSQMLVEFLEHLIFQSSSQCSSQVYSTLLEHYLEVWGREEDPTCKQQYEQKVISLLESPKSTCDKSQALILCKEAKFVSGLLFLYEQQKMYQSILKYHVSQKDYGSVMVCCRRFGPQDPTLWVQALWSLSTFHDLPSRLLDEILDVIGKEGLLSPLLVVGALSHVPTVKVGAVKGYLNKVLQEEVALMEEQQALIYQFTEEIFKIQETVNRIQTKPTVFQSSRCSICQKPLELPSIHFLCQHSYHQHCIQGFSDNETECLECLHANKTILDALRCQEESQDLNEQFHSQLDLSNDSFVLISQFLGRGVFTNLTSFNQMSLHAAAMKKKLRSHILPFSKALYCETQETFNHDAAPQKTQVIENMDPGIWMLSDYRSNLSEALYSYRLTAPTLPPSSDCIVSSITPVVKPPPPSTNPFDVASTNPFEEDMEEDDGDNYDSKLNPFAD